MSGRVVYHHIKGLYQTRKIGIGFLSGSEMGDIPYISNAFLITEGDRIKQFGPMEECPEEKGIDMSGRFIFPAFVDAHTHLVYAGSREGEFRLKIQGVPYAEIAKRGGGILNSASQTAKASEDELYEQSAARAKQVMGTGTGTIEIKSGYGLDLPGELKLLRVANRLKKTLPATIRTTFMGAHAFPTRISRQQYIQEIIQEMIPAVAENKLADYMDVFCETGFFSPSETEEILHAGKRYGLIPRLHANQLGHSGGVEVGVRMKAASVDHLEYLDDVEIGILKGSDTMPTALPASSFYLNLPYPPARRMIDSGLPVAIASDYNPGSAPSGNMSFVWSLACIKMKMTPEEAYNAATVNPAYSLGLAGQSGVVAVGAFADFCITRPIPSFDFIPYSFGYTSISRVVLKGKPLEDYSL